MRVLIQADMEGVAQITSVHQVVPLWPDYWETGRKQLTDDVIAAATGLLAGGAGEVVVDDQHLGGINSIMRERLPKRVSMPGPDVIYQELQQRAFDAVFQVGRHSRWGTNDGFIAHTQMPGISLAIDGQPFTESHIGAWRAGVPVLGITGDDRLGPQLDGALTGTPFLAVKHSRTLTETCPIRSDRSRSRAAIRNFATRCAQNWRDRSAVELPARFTLTAHLEPTVAQLLDGEHRLKLAGRSVVCIHCTDWWHDAEPAMQAATGAVARPFFEALSPLGLTAPDKLDQIDPATLEQTRVLFTTWLNEPEKIWNE